MRWPRPISTWLPPPNCLVEAMVENRCAQGHPGVGIDRYAPGINQCCPSVTNRTLHRINALLRKNSQDRRLTTPTSGRMSRALTKTHDPEKCGAGFREDRALSNGLVNPY